MTDSLEESSINNTSNLAQLKSAHRSFFAHETISATGIRFNNTHIFVANIDGTIGVYDRETGQQRERLKGHTSGVCTLQCTRQTLVSGSSDCTVRIWDLTTMKLRHILRGHQATVRTMHILDSAHLRVKGKLEPSYQVIVTGSGDSTIRVWRLPEEDANSQTSSETVLTPIVVSAGHDSSTTNSTSDHFLLRTCQGHSAAITATVVDGGKCVSGSTDKTVRVWDIESGQCEHVFEGHTDRITSVAYNHDRQLALSGSATLDGTIRVWDTRNGTCLAVLPDHDSHISYLRFDRDTFLSAATGSVKVWDASAHTLRLSMSSSIYITSLAVKGGKVVTAGGEVVRMWDPSTGITIWETDIGRPVRMVEWKDDCLVVLSMIEGPKSQTPRIDVYDFTRP